VQRLKEAAEKAKIELSAVQETTVNLPSSPRRPTPQAPRHQVTRAKFNELTADLVDKCRGPFRPGDQGRGSHPRQDRPRHHGRWLDTYPRRQELVTKVTGKEPNKSVNPDEVVRSAPPYRPACEGRREGHLVA